MANDYYMNPFQPNETGVGPYNGFSIGVENLRRGLELAPFKKMERERQQMELEKQKQTQSEFMSPEAIAARQSAFPKQQAENVLGQGQAEQKTGLLPLETENLTEQARQHLAETKGKPAGQFLEELGNSAETLSMAPEGFKPQLYESIVKGIQARHPGMEFPDEWKKYNPGVERHLTALHQALVNTPKHSQEMEKGQQTGAFQVEASRIRGEEAARLRASIMQELRATGQLKENPGQELSRIRRELSDPKTSPEKKAQLEQELEMSASPLIDDKLAKKYGNESNALLLGGSNPDFMAKRKSAMDAERQQLRKSYGLKRDDDLVDVLSPDGKRGTIPRNKLDAAKKSGYKEQ